MIDWASVQTYYAGSFPNVLAINSTGAATQDGTEYIAEQINNGIFGPSQAFMDYAGLTPNGVTEAAGASQLLTALQLGHAIGPGTYRRYAKSTAPSVTGDRLLILSGQGILRANYTALDTAVYVGDPNNATAPYFYHADDAAGTIRNTAGIYLILPPENPTYLKQYSEAAGDFTITGPATWTTDSAIATPYKLSSGEWRLAFNISATIVGAAASSSMTIAFSGVTFAGASGIRPAISIYDGLRASRAANEYGYARTTGASNNLAVIFATSITLNTSWGFSGDVGLSSAPTWADGFDYPIGIVY